MALQKFFMIRRSPVLLCLLFLLVGRCQALPVVREVFFSLTDSDIAVILDTHNTLRSNVEPSSSNMQALVSSAIAFK